MHVLHHFVLWFCPWTSRSHFCGRITWSTTSRRDENIAKHHGSHSGDFFSVQIISPIQSQDHNVLKKWSMSLRGRFVLRQLHRLYMTATSCSLVNHFYSHSWGCSVNYEHFFETASLIWFSSVLTQHRRWVKTRTHADTAGLRSPIAPLWSKPLRATVRASYTVCVCVWECVGRECVTQM